jgi:hypothetical protein
MAEVDGMSTRTAERQNALHKHVRIILKNLSTLQTASDASRYKNKYRLQIKIHTGKQIILECEYSII